MYVINLSKFFIVLVSRIGFQMTESARDLRCDLIVFFISLIHPKESLLNMPLN